MAKSGRINISQAETMRYKKIQNLISLLQGKGNTVAVDAIWGNGSPSPIAFSLGRRIAVDGEKIRIGKKSYNAYEIEKVVINAEGSMAIYDHFGKKLCGCLRLNASTDNIELFCVWVQKSNIPVEIVSGRRERFFQYAILSIAVAAKVLYEVLKAL